MKLPKEYLSYSAYNLWKKNKEQYRRRYYLKEEPIQTPETEFGKEVARRLEKGERINPAIIAEGVPEFKIETQIKDLRLIGFIDRFNPATLQIVEYKTGHVSLKTGTAPWDNVKVRRLEQLVFYCMLTRLKYGNYNRTVVLQWIETKFEIKTMIMHNYELSSISKKLVLTDNIRTFIRKIYKRELDDMEKKVYQVAMEISQDYQKWLTDTATGDSI